MTRGSQGLGRRGEDLAAEHFARRGCRLLARNHHTRFGELDLVLADGGTLVFCEVKTRRSGAFGAPVEAVSRNKQVRLRHLAARWLEEAPMRPTEIRFDVASVLAGEIEVLEGAF